MGMQKTAGFTIIETMLVLAVTGMTVIGLLAGATVQINSGEYRSSLQEFYAEMQNQYTVVQNPINDRTESQDVCNATPLSKGSSPSCLIVGRLVSGSATQVTETPVIGSNANPSLDITDSAGTPAGANGWTLYLDTNNSVTYTLSWGSTLQAVLGGGAPKTTFNALIVMSPADGLLRTYSDTNAPIPAASSLYPLLATSQQALTLCLESAIAPTVGGALAVQLAANASGSNSVTLPPQTQLSGVC